MISRWDRGKAKIVEALLGVKIWRLPGDIGRVRLMTEGAMTWYSTCLVRNINGSGVVVVVLGASGRGNGDDLLRLGMRETLVVGIETDGEVPPEINIGGAR